jgi:hypothetical protein
MESREDEGTRHNKAERTRWVSECVEAKVEPVRGGRWSKRKQDRSANAGKKGGRMGRVDGRQETFGGLGQGRSGRKGELDHRQPFISTLVRTRTDSTQSVLLFIRPAFFVPSC